MRARLAPRPTLFGLRHVRVGGTHRPTWRYNSALLVDRDGTPVGRYDKIHLVPFGEYVPMGETLPFMSMFTPYEGNYSCKPGEMWTRFPLHGRRPDVPFRLPDLL